ncbi:MAG TPA: hypothetical protein VEN81_05605 [Planctomycetota bacterium]|nr:hypothetical protein [Planctomycetota bacterium]
MILALGILPILLVLRGEDDGGEGLRRLRWDAGIGTGSKGLADPAPWPRCDEVRESCDPPTPDGESPSEPGGPRTGIPEAEWGAGPGILEPEGLGWFVGASALGREVNGHLRVREHDVAGSTLNFRKDLGLDFAEGGQFTLGSRSPGYEASLDVEYLTGSGRHTLNRDVFYNGTTYAAGIPIHTLWEFLTVRGLVELQEVAWRPSFGEVAPVVGVEYPYYLTNVTSRAISHNSEDWTHNYPYPVLGAVGRFPLAEDLSVGGRLTVAYVPNVASVYTEGGRLYVSTRPSVAVDLPFDWRWTDRLLLTVDLQYRYWNGRDHSVEDGNVLRFSTPGLSLGVRYRW